MDNIYDIQNWQTIPENSISFKTKTKSDTEYWKLKIYKQGNIECFVIVDKYINGTLDETVTFLDENEVNEAFNTL